MVFSNYNNPTYWDRQAKANSEEEWQTMLTLIRCRILRHLIRVYPVCRSSSNLLDASTGSRIGVFKF